MTALAARDVVVGTRLQRVSLSMEPGTLTAIVGENGAGKSTLLDALAGIHPLTSGRVTLDDVDVRTLSPRDRARAIASLGQRSVDVDDLTAAERIAQGLAPKRGSRALVDDAALALVENSARELAVDAFLARKLGTLSTGERRRVEVARALVDQDARVVLVDEPHSGVDVRHQSLVSTALRRRARQGAIVVMSVHDLGVAGVADRVVGLRAGEVVVDAPMLDAAAIEALYDVTGAIVVREGTAIGVLLPR